MDQSTPRTRIWTIAFSGIVIAAYAAIMFATQSFSFGPYQIRLATSLYALAYPFPFLVIPLGLANSLSNVLGGMGPWDILGGAVAGLVTGGAIALIRRFRLPMALVIAPIVLGPGLLVPIWLSYLLNMPYLPLALSLCIGQTPPALLGYLLLRVLKRAKLIHL